MSGGVVRLGAPRPIAPGAPVPTTQPESAVPAPRVPAGGPTSPDRVPVERALISVYDKTGLLDLAAALAGAGTEIVSKIGRAHV